MIDYTESLPGEAQEADLRFIEIRKWQTGSGATTAGRIRFLRWSCII